MPCFQSTAGFRKTADMVRNFQKECFLKAEFSHQSANSLIRPTCYLGYEMASCRLERWSLLYLYSKKRLTGVIHLLHPLSWPSPTLREA